MEFKFDVNDVFKGPVVEINQNLIPPGFKGDRRQLWETVNKVSEVINAMGEASASAQGLSKPITTAERLRNSDQTVYLLVDDKAHNGKGAVTGMLKTGKKGLYVFDRNGQHYQVSPPCVLDFYVHESKQRQGLGKKLFEHMLEKEKVEPVKMAIDRPSDKLLGFLNKHYGLQSPVKQMNNFVVFDEFFPNRQANKEDGDSNRAISSRTRGANGLQSSPASSSPYGRYGAPRPPCSMGQIIHNQTSVLSRASEPAGDVQPEGEDSQGEDKPKLERPSSLSLTTSEEQNDLDGKDGLENGEVQNAEKDQSNVEKDDEKAIENGIEKLSVVVNEDMNVDLGEQNVELDGKTTPSDSGRKTPGLTAQGYFDLKFYHSRLW